MAVVTRGAWAKRLCDAYDLHLTDHRKYAIVSWETAEGTMAKYNPLATTLFMPGCTFFNLVGVKNYPNLKSGITATVRTLAESGHGYEGILAALHANASALEILSAVSDSDWGTGVLAEAVLPYVKADYELYANRPIGQ